MIYILVTWGLLSYFFIDNILFGNAQFSSYLTLNFPLFSNEKITDSFT